MTNKLNSIDIASLAKVTGGAGFGQGQGYTFPSMPMAGTQGGSSPNFMTCNPSATQGRLDCTDKSGMNWNMPASAGTATGLSGGTPTGGGGGGD